MGQHFIDYRTDDIDEIFDAHDPCCSHTSYMQMTPGTLDYRGQYVLLDGLSIAWNHYGQRILFSELPDGEDLSIGFVTAADGDFYLCNRELSPRSMVVFQPGQVMDYVNPRVTESLIVTVKDELRQRLGLTLDPDMVKELSDHQIDGFIRECRRITEIARHLDNSPEAEITAVGLRDDMIIALTDLLDSWMLAGAGDIAPVKSLNQAYTLIRRAGNLYRTGDYRPTTSIAEMARDLGVSERTLYYAFRKWMGCSPQAYFRIRQLDMFRKRLLESNTVKGEITRIGLECGFTHMGRLAQMYQRQYGERPSDTIRRKRPA